MSNTIEAPSVEEIAGIVGEVTWELTDKHGNLKRHGVSKNLITQVGDQMYGERGAGITTTATPTGMKLGTGGTAVAKTGAGAALVTYLSDSHQAFDGTYPQSSLSTGRVITYRVTFAAGKATTASAITEAVIVNEALANATSAAAATISRVLLTGIGSKGASDTLTITWTHTILGA
jgi:hypothetical protein